MSGHTPGPWKLSRANRSPTTGEWMISGSKPGYLAEVRDCDSGDVKANANLIAAAPELLEALETIMSNQTGLQENIDAERKARAAIAKAKGEV